MIKYLTLSLLLLCIFCCKKDGAYDWSKHIVIDSTTLIGYNQLRIKVSIHNLADSQVLEAGVCWDHVREDPTKYSQFITFADRTDMDTLITGLLQGRPIYFRAFVTTKKGTIYSQVVIVNTRSITKLWEEDHPTQIQHIKQIEQVPGLGFYILAQDSATDKRWPELLLLNYQGDLIWHKHYYRDQAHTTPDYLMALPDGLLVATTHHTPTGDKTFLMKTQADVDPIWDKAFTQLYHNEFVRLRPGPNNTIILTTKSWDKPIAGVDTKYFLVDHHIDMNGDHTQPNTIVPLDPIFARANLTGTTDVGSNGFVAVTHMPTDINDAGSPSDIFLHRFDNNMMVSQQKFGGIKPDAPVSIITSTAGNPVVLGYSQSKGAIAQSAWLFELDAASGNPHWEFLYQNSFFGFPSRMYPLGLQPVKTGGYLIAGNIGMSRYSAFTDGFFAFIDGNGQLRWDCFIEHDNNQDLYIDYPKDVFEINGMLYVIGTLNGYDDDDVSTLYMIQYKP
ncbi:hypothetical protein HB364_13890 [Pseudoflavitalea sp. X16]|uniref:hypothetical protein n=1 Tax=Paraflavitalea devenefica TaxID=2716334 RepID=UPI00141DE806|nr:hypothetical protein [Paraflavitalea devenefica]NII26180.1 hypothetical protein [Paraflavitalea devenefica]